MRAAHWVVPMWLLGGCSQPVIEGVAQDGAGVPIEAAQVSLSGTACQGVTNADGRFLFPCDPGVYSLVLEKAGYIPETLPGQRVERGARNDLGIIRLVAIPEQRGLFRVEGGVARAMEPGRIVRSMGGSGIEAFKHYCLPPDAPAGTPIPSGALELIDHGATPWRAFRLDNEGCAYKMSPSGEDRWDVDYAEYPEQTAREVGPGTRSVTMNLPAGRVFLADWNKGFFTRIESTEEGKEGYSGYLLDVVEEQVTASAP